MVRCLSDCTFFFFNDTATTEIYTLSLHDALPIFDPARRYAIDPDLRSELDRKRFGETNLAAFRSRSEEHTSELQSPDHLVCRLLLEKKKNVQTRSELSRVEAEMDQLLIFP